MCDGDSSPCPDCQGEGVIVLQRCPRREAAEAFDVLTIAEDAKRGSWPAGGGTGDQTKRCTALVRFAWHEMDGHEADQIRRQLDP